MEHSYKINLMKQRSYKKKVVKMVMGNANIQSTGIELFWFFQILDNIMVSISACLAGD